MTLAATLCVGTRRSVSPPTLTDHERNAVLSLSRNLPTLWNASTTAPSDRQRIVRLLLQRVVINVQGTSNHVDVALHWAGGFTSQHELTRPVLSYAQMENYEQLVARIKELRSQGLSFASVAEHVNREGFRPPKGAEKFKTDMVSLFLRRLEKRPPGWKAKAPSGLLQENEWLVTDLAAELEVPKNTLFAWIKRGWVRVARQLPGYRGRTICWADANELDRLCRLRQTKHGWWDPPLPAELITPTAAEVESIVSRRLVTADMP